MQVRVGKVVALALLLASCRRIPASEAGPVSDGAASAPQQSSHVFTEPGSTTRKILLNPDSTTAFRVASQFTPEYTKLQGKPAVAGMPILEEAPISSSDAANVAQIVVQPASYALDGQQSTCIPRPGWVVQYRRGESAVNVVISDTCSYVFIWPEKSVGETGGGGDTSPVAKQLFEVIQKIFANSGT